MTAPPIPADPPLASPSAPALLLPTALLGPLLVPGGADCASEIAVPGRGFLLSIGRSKTDQQGRGELVAIAANPADPGFCPYTGSPHGAPGEAGAIQRVQVPSG